jgi:ribonuclease HI
VPKEDRPHLELFTDGACSGNPGPGGWAYILRDVKTGTERCGSDGEASTTNNRMELISVIEGLQTLDRPCTVDLYSDSQYVINGLREWMDGWKARGWKRGKNQPVKNVELWKQLDELRHRHTLNPNWVKGHDDHPENERCDRMAVAAVELYR